jgi:hypothetical protein
VKIVVETEDFEGFGAYHPKPGDTLQVESIYDLEAEGWGYGYWDLKVIEVLDE